MKTILIVDDQKAWRDRVRQFIAEAGHRTIEADCCDTALKAVGKGRPDLILLDYRMPGKTGVEIAQRIRSCEGCETIPIIIVSGEELPGDCQGTPLPHVNGFIDKKDLHDSLLGCLERYFTAPEQAAEST